MPCLGRSAASKPVSSCVSGSVEKTSGADLASSVKRIQTSICRLHPPCPLGVMNSSVPVGRAAKAIEVNSVAANAVRVLLWDKCSFMERSPVVTLLSLGAC